MSLYRLVTLAQAKRNLRYDSTADDADLLDLVNDASQIVMNYLEAVGSRARQFSGDTAVSASDIAAYAAAFDGWTDSSGIPLVDSNGDPLIVDYETDSTGAPILDSNGDHIGGRSIIPGPVRRATLLVINALDKERAGIGNPGQVAEPLNPISPAVAAVLVRFRPPTAA